MNRSLDCAAKARGLPRANRAASLGMTESEHALEDPFAALAGAHHLPAGGLVEAVGAAAGLGRQRGGAMAMPAEHVAGLLEQAAADAATFMGGIDRKSTRLNSSHVS